MASDSLEVYATHRPSGEKVAAALPVGCLQERLGELGSIRRDEEPEVGQRVVVELQKYSSTTPSGDHDPGPLLSVLVLDQKARPALQPAPPKRE